jgi:hypothetical protein
MKNVEVRVINKNTLELLEDAKAGDRISLNEINQIDNSFIDTLISSKEAERFEASYKIKMEELKNAKENEIKDLKHNNELKIAELNNSLEILKKESLKDLETTEIKTRNESALKIQELTQQIQALKDISAKEKESAVILATQDKTIEIEKLKSQLTSLEDDYKVKLELANTTSTNIMNEKIEELKTQLSEKDFEINNFKMQKAALKSKNLGESLEQWCEDRWKEARTYGAFADCTFIKDNDAVEGDDNKKTKGDFVFRIYSEEPYEDKNQLSSVALEMKTDDESSKTRKKNEDFYEKLNKDRIKKNCEYALLVSTLEEKDVDDVPIRVVDGYEKMYIVRPQYMLIFLSIIYNLTKKYKDLVIEKQKEDTEFIDKQQLLNEFDDLKRTYFINPINALSKQVTEIRENCDVITKANQKSIENCEKITNDTLQKILDKINTFEIKNLKSIAKKVDSFNHNENN